MKSTEKTRDTSRNSEGIEYNVPNNRLTFPRALGVRVVKQIVAYAVDFIYGYSYLIPSEL